MYRFSNNQKMDSSTIELMVPLITYQIMDLSVLIPLCII